MKNISSKKNKNKNNSGYSLIEMIVYVALIGVVSIFIYSIILFIYYDNQRIINLTRINSNAYSVMERIRYEIENANYVYLPTSNMENYNYNSARADQLSLATEIGVSLDENITFVDLYLENGTIFLKKEKLLESIALTSSGVVVSDLNFSYYKNGSRESVAIDIIIEPKNDSVSTSPIYLTSIIALRSF